MKKKLQPVFSSGRFQFCFLMLFSFFASVSLYAQTVTGKVTDGSNKPLGGVTVTVKGAGRSTLTSDEGNFSISAKGTDVLVLSSVGFSTLEVPVNRRSNITVNMISGSGQQSLDEVVVTALGIKRQSKRLGYSATSVNTDELVKNRTTNMMESLEGKVAGLNITPPAAGAGSSTQIRLRGQVGFAGGTNSPLIVVNGLPMSQGARGADGGNNMRDQGDNLQAINPDDIESMTVLKGSTASALYGSRAAAGAIIITTKSGSKNQGIGVEFTSGYTTHEALNYMDQFQSVYGLGQGGLKPSGQADAAGKGQFGWGAKLDGSLVPTFDGTMQPYIFHKDRLFDYLQTGSNFTNSIALSGGGANGSYRVAFANSDAKGIVPRDEYKKKIFNVGLNQNVTNKLKLSVNINWSNEIQSNPPQIGTQGPGPVNFFTRLAPSISTSSLKNNAFNTAPTAAFGTEVQTTGFQGTLLNPYYADQAGQNWVNNRDHILATATLRYDITKWLYIQGRYNYDYNISANESKIPFGIGTSIPTNADGTYKGSYTVSEGKQTDINADFLLGGNKEFGKFSVDASVGGNTLRSKGTTFIQNSTNFIVKDLYSLGNGNVKTPSYFYGKSRVNSLYGLAEFGYNRLLYITFTGRTDWFSTLNPLNNHLFYPSVSTSFIFSELLGKYEWLNYGKLRVAWAKTGSADGAGAYEGILNYAPSSNNFNGQATASIGGNGQSPNPLIQPFALEEKEIGVELRMFKSRVNLDISVFKKVTTDQILPVTLSNTSGYTSSKANLASLRNSGLETMLEVKPIETRNFTWTSSWNNTYLSTKVLAISPGVNDFLLIQFNGTVGNAAPGVEFLGEVHYTVGLPMNQLYTRTYLRNAKGGIVVKDDGKLLATPDFKPIGSSIPKFTGGWSNTFSYKNISLGVFIDYKFGGKVMSATLLNLTRQGLSKLSLEGRREGETGLTFPAFYQSGAPNTSIVTDLQGFYTDYRNLQIGDPFVFKSDFIKLRNISLSYNFTSLLKKVSYLQFCKGLSLSASVRNVAILHKDLPGLDPEAIQSSGDTRAGYENAALPTTRNYNLSLNIKF
ncbi:MAG: SusC/RagA family TonB-linked outer membrane protein [Ferruginibacter sp.]